MKETVTIRKSDVEKLGKELIKEIDIFLHDEYIINNFLELKPDQQKFDEGVKKSKDLDVEDIYHLLVKIKLDDEIYGDLYYKKESFLNLFKVLLTGHFYLPE